MMALLLLGKKAMANAIKQDIVCCLDIELEDVEEQPDLVCQRRVE